MLPHQRPAFATCRYWSREPGWRFNAGTTGSAPTAAAVHVDGVRRHELASVRAHEQHQLADLFGLAEPAHRDVVHELLVLLGGGGRCVLKRRLDRSGRN